MGDTVDEGDDPLATLEVGVTEDGELTEGGVVDFTDGEPLEFLTPGEVAPQCFSSVFVGTGLLIREVTPPRDALRFSVALVTLGAAEVAVLGDDFLKDEDGDSFLKDEEGESILLIIDAPLISGDRFLMPEEVTPEVPVGEVLAGGVVVTPLPLPLLIVLLNSCPPTLIRLACAAVDDDRRKVRGWLGEVP